MYQSTQAIGNASKLNAEYWAAFVGLPANQTLFVGLYAVEPLGLLAEDQPHVMTDGIEAAGSCNAYRLTLRRSLSTYIGRLFIEWGLGYRSWIQRADGQAKSVVEIRSELAEPTFPGFASLIIRLSDIGALPRTWISALSSTRGIYLLTCPRTREQYVGMASGSQGFMGRWHEYLVSGHGGNIGLKSRNLENYQISILETIGNSGTHEDLLALEARWKAKLQSMEMGLNRN